MKIKLFQTNNYFKAMKNSILQRLKARKELVFVFLLTMFFLFFFGTTNDGTAGQKAIVGGVDTCTVKNQNFWTGNFRVADKNGKEFSVKPSEVLFVGLDSDYTQN